MTDTATTPPVTIVPANEASWEDLDVSSASPGAWAGRAEDKTDHSIWAVTCFVTRTDFRRRGVSRALARAAARPEPLLG